MKYELIMLPQSILVSDEEFVDYVTEIEEDEYNQMKNI